MLWYKKCSGKGGNVTSAGWQVTLWSRMICESGSAVVNRWSPFTFLLLFQSLRFVLTVFGAVLFLSVCVCKCSSVLIYMYYTHTRLTALCPGLPGSAGNRKVKPIWILLKQETMYGSGISWAICNSLVRYVILAISVAKIDFIVFLA